MKTNLYHLGAPCSIKKLEKFLLLNDAVSQEQYYDELCFGNYRVDYILESFNVNIERERGVWSISISDVNGDCFGINFLMCILKEKEDYLAKKISLEEQVRFLQEKFVEINELLGAESLPKILKKLHQLREKLFAYQCPLWVFD